MLPVGAASAATPNPIVPITPLTPVIPIQPPILDNSFEYSVSNGKATITAYKGTSSKVVIPSKLGGYPVTAIGNAALDELDLMTSVTVPEGVVSIGNDAFTGCDKLTSVNLPNSLISIGMFGFDACDSLTTFTLPPNLQELGDYVFASTPIEHLNIPASLTVVNAATFGFCDSIEGIDVDPGNPVYSSQDGIIFSKDKTKLLYYPHGKADATYVVPAGVKVIGKNAFSNNKHIVNITLPEGLNEIEGNAFASCTALKTMTIPASTFMVGAGAFGSCAALTDVVFLNPNTQLGSDLFVYCHSLTTLTLPSGLHTIPKGLFYWCAGLKTIVIPNGVTKIETDAFNHCINLTSITLPSSLQYIGHRAFFDCAALPNIALPGALTTIDVNAFAYCTNLPSITFPASIKTLGEGAFNHCSNLQDARFMGNAPPIVAYLFTQGHPDFKIYYPSGAQGWTTPYWASYPTIPYNNYAALTPAIQAPAIRFELPKPEPVRLSARGRISLDLLVPVPATEPQTPPQHKVIDIIPPPPITVLPAPVVPTPTPLPIPVPVPSGSTAIKFYLDQPNYQVNGQPGVMDTNPVVIGGRMLLPVRFVAEPLGAVPVWDEPSRKVTIILGDNTIEVWIDVATARVNGAEKLIEPGDPSVKPIIINGRTMLPLRFIAENLGCEVQWNEALKEATLIKL